jgi:holin (3TMs family)
VAFSIQDIIGGSALQFVKGIIDDFHLPAEDKAKFVAAADANQTTLQLKQYEMQERLQDALTAEVQAAGENIRAEATSGDAYTRRARPSFLYAMLAILLANYVLFPMIGHAPIVFPDQLFWLFGFCMLGYTGARTWEKIAQSGDTKTN